MSCTRTHDVESRRGTRERRLGPAIRRANTYRVGEARNAKRKSGGFRRVATQLYDVAVIGGGGRVGLPLALVFADSGLRTVIYDINCQTIQTICAGRMPFREAGAEEILRRVLAHGTLVAQDTPDLLRECRFLVLIVGTPVDEHLNPSFAGIFRALEGCREYLRDGQTLVLRSTVFPGMTRHIERYLQENGLAIKVAFCPERVAQGNSIQEFQSLPQIIGAD